MARKDLAHRQDVAVRVDAALGYAGGAGGEGNQGRIIGSAVEGREFIRLLCQQLMEGVVSVKLDLFQVRAVGTRQLQLQRQ